MFRNLFMHRAMFKPAATSSVTYSEAHTLTWGQRLCKAWRLRMNPEPMGQYNLGSFRKWTWSELVVALLPASGHKRLVRHASETEGSQPPNCLQNKHGRDRTVEIANTFQRQVILWSDGHSTCLWHQYFPVITILSFLVWRNNHTMHSFRNSDDKQLCFKEF